MDEADQAREYSEVFIGVEIERCIANAESGTRIGGGMDCEDCGREIPANRRAALPGCTRCITCQAEFEMEKKTFGEHLPKRSVV